MLVEGISDQLALQTLAARLGRNLAAEGIAVEPMGGAHRIASFLERLGPRGEDFELAGLRDVGEEREFRRALERAGSALTSIGRKWNGWGSSCASPTWRTS